MQQKRSLKSTSSKASKVRESKGAAAFRPETKEPTILVPDEPPEMAEPKIIAFYLPQFHPFPENDSWWGAGFTEWTNVASSRPLYEGHYQPHQPSDLGFYDLRVRETRQKQADLAKVYGVYGFCYHYYWFSGRRILEQPLDLMLADGEPSLPFCICWANESWSRRWDGSERDLLIAQIHDPEIDKRLILDLLPLLNHKDYIKVGDCPIIVIYRVALMPEPKEVFSHWRSVALDNGLAGLHICMAETFGLHDPYSYGCDSAVEFPPHKTSSSLVNSTLTNVAAGYTGNVYSYEEVVLNEVVAVPPPYTRFRTVMPSWDNTARRGLLGNVFQGASPELYELWLREMLDYTRRQFKPSEQLIFVNAWNEWGEGAHLEPDVLNGRGYLEATRRAFAGIPDWKQAFASLEIRLAKDPTARTMLDQLEQVYKSYIRSLSAMAAKFERLRKDWPYAKFSSRKESELSGLEIVECRGHIDRLNQYTANRDVRLSSSQYLNFGGWTITPGHTLSEELPTFLCVTPENNKDEELVVRLPDRFARPDVVDFLSISEAEGLWSGVTGSLHLSTLPAGTYRLVIETIHNDFVARMVSGWNIVVT